MKFRAEDIAFWILSLAALGIVMWLLHGSPTLEQALISIVVLIISSEFMLWRKYHEVDKNTALSFLRFKQDIQSIHEQLDKMQPSQERMEQKIVSMERLMRSKK